MAFDQAALLWAWIHKVQFRLVVVPHLKMFWVQTPKCASISVRDELRKIGGEEVGDNSRWLYQFMRTAEARHLCEWKRVMTVRDPFARAVSIHSFFSQREDGYFGRLSGTFADFTKDPFSHTEKWETWSHFLPMSYWAQCEGQWMITDVVRLESPHKQIADLLGIDGFRLPKVNASRHGPVSDYYDDDTQAAVVEAYREDFENFDYPMEVACEASSI